MRRAPGLPQPEIFLQPAVGVIDAAIEHQFGGPHFQPLGREFRQQRDRVVVQLPPADRVQIAKQVDDFRTPGPPKVASHRDAFVVQRLRRHLRQRQFLARHGWDDFGLAHAIPIWPTTTPDEIR